MIKTSLKKKNSWTYVYKKNKLDDLQTRLIRLADVNLNIHQTNYFTELTANSFLKMKKLAPYVELKLLLCIVTLSFR